MNTIGLGMAMDGNSLITKSRSNQGKINGYRKSCQGY